MLTRTNIESVLGEANNIASLLNSTCNTKSPALALGLLAVGIVAYKEFCQDREELVSDLALLFEYIAELDTPPKVN